MGSGVAGAAGIFAATGVAGVASATGSSTTQDEEAGEPSNDGPAAVVSSHHLATDAGLDVLAEGGTAADAAVAVAAALSVVEPWFSSALGVARGRCTTTPIRRM